jgi:hypothetical protein
MESGVPSGPTERGRTAGHPGAALRATIAQAAHEKGGGRGRVGERVRRGWSAP